jgi:hypothetical protein
LSHYDDDMVAGLFCWLQLDDHGECEQQLLHHKANLLTGLFISRRMSAASHQKRAEVAGAHTSHVAQIKAALHEIVPGMCRENRAVECQDFRTPLRQRGALCRCGAVETG